MVCISIVGIACLYGLFMVIVYRTGLSDGLKITKGKDIEPVISGEKKKTESSTQVDIRTESILKNIDNYDGTSSGQIKID